MGFSATPATRVSQRFMGMSTRTASLVPTAMAMAGVTSPIRASAMTMPNGPVMTLARRALTTTAFSPVAARSAPPLSIFSVAVELVPTATMSA